jgi:hypothetical protein
MSGGPTVNALIAHSLVGSYFSARSCLILSASLLALARSIAMSQASQTASSCVTPPM